LIGITQPSVAKCNADKLHQLVCNDHQLMQAVGIANNWFVAFIMVSGAKI